MSSWRSGPGLRGGTRRSVLVWGSLAQGKWLYFRLIAAALTNFLGLATSLFIMVVYDRVVRMGQSIADSLTVGVSIALGFDFLIKTPGAVCRPRGTAGEGVWRGSFLTSC